MKYLIVKAYGKQQFLNESGVRRLDVMGNITENSVTENVDEAARVTDDGIGKIARELNRLNVSTQVARD